MACFITEFGYLMTWDGFENFNVIVPLLCGTNSFLKSAYYSQIWKYGLF